MLREKERVKAKSHIRTLVAFWRALMSPVLLLEPRDTVTTGGQDECEHLFAVSDDRRARDVPALWNGRFGSDKARD